MNFATDKILLSGLLLTVTGNNIYLQGLLIGSGNFDGLGTSSNTGRILYNDTTGASGSLSNTILNSGQQSWSAANNNGINLSGKLLSTGQTLYNDITGMSGTFLSGPFSGIYSTGINNISGFMTGISGYITLKPYISYFNWITSSTSLTNSISNPIIVYQTFFDFTNFTGINFVVNILTGLSGVATSGNGIAYIGYSTTFSTSPSSYSFIDTSGSAAIVSGFRQIYNQGFRPLVNTAKSGVYVAFIISGNSLSKAGPTLGHTYMALM